MRKMKNKVLKALAYINGFVLICAMCGADSDNIYIPLTLIAVTGTWLMLFAYANGYLSIKYKEVEREKVVYDAPDVIFDRIAKLQDEINNAMAEFKEKYL